MTTDADALPWYRHFWPWFLIGLVGSVVLASLVTLGIALSEPDPLVVSDAEYRELRAGFRPDAAAEVLAGEDGKGEGDTTAGDESGDDDD